MSKNFQNERDTSGSVAVCVYRLRFRPWTPSICRKSFDFRSFQTSSVLCNLAAHRWNRPPEFTWTSWAAARSRWFLLFYKIPYGTLVDRFSKTKSVFPPGLHPQEYFRRGIQLAACSWAITTIEGIVYAKTEAGTMEVMVDGDHGEWCYYEWVLLSYYRYRLTRCLVYISRIARGEISPLLPKHCTL